ncbi:MAG: FtsL-like putative cell division protein [Putridiphycobacter sp.]|nr:FtsL-like putative cell division protein [Putridiphycobacter sp.]
MNELKAEADINKPRKEKKRKLAKVITGEFLSRSEIINNIPFISFLGFLLVVLIGWGYYTETVGKKEVQLEKELGELNSEFFSLGVEYNKLSRQTQVSERLEGSELQESTIPPKKLKVKKYNF